MADVDEDLGQADLLLAALLHLRLNQLAKRFFLDVHEEALPHEFDVSL